VLLIDCFQAGSSLHIRKEPVNKCKIIGMNMELTGWRELARLLKLLGANKGHDPSIAASMPTKFL